MPAPHPVVPLPPPVFATTTSRKPIRRAVAWVLGTVLAVVAAGIILSNTRAGTAPPPGPSSTAPGGHSGVPVGCHEQSCDGQDPADNGCDKDAKTMKFFRDGSFEIRLRYSPSCNAAWVQVNPIGYRAWIEARTSPTESAELVAKRSIDAGSQYSRMVSHQNSVRACADTDAGETICTGFY